MLVYFNTHSDKLQLIAHRKQSWENSMEKACLLLNNEDINEFKQALTFFHVQELRDLANQLHLPNKGDKMHLVMRIITFVQTGKILIEPKIPPLSCAQRGKEYSLSSSTLMLKGAYKNDLKTRVFFKSLIGNHFHFTAFGIDWLNEQWIKGTPPTYQKFADMWQLEFIRRKTSPAAPKEAWAYINFVQHFLSHNPKVSRETLLHAWQKERELHKNKVQILLKNHQMSNKA